MCASPEHVPRHEVDRLLSAARARLAAAAASRGAAWGAVAAFLVALTLMLAQGGSRDSVAQGSRDSVAQGFSPAIVDAIVDVRLGLGVALLVLTACIAFAWMRARRAGLRAIADAVERRAPAFRNTLITAIELRTHPDRTSSFIAARIERDAAAVAAATSVGALFPLRRESMRAAACAVPLALLAAIGVFRPDLVERARERAVSSRAPAGTSTLSIDAIVTPPTYAGLPQAALKNPDRIQALEGSRVAFTIASSSASLRLKSETGAARALTRDARGRFAAELPLRSGYVIFEGDRPADRHLVALVAVPDTAPVVRVTAPGRDLIFPDAARRVSFALAASDDLALRSLKLQFTRVSGSGETFEFNEGEIPVEITTREARAWDARASASLAGLGLEPGDTLVYRAAAADARPDSVGVSDAFVIEIGKAAEGLSEGFAIGDEQNKYAISQQMVIVKTERLHARRGSLAARAFTAESQAIAAEQRMVRAEFVFMMGGEVEDEDVEAAQSTELQEGRLENRGQIDMRAAIRLMSDAERQLVAANTGRALPAERAALAALERAFSRTRYILRTIAARNRIDVSRRLSGDRSDAASWTLTVPVAGGTMPVPPLGEVLAETIALSEARDWTLDASRRAAVLAERTMALVARGSRDPVAQGSRDPVAQGFSPANADAGRPEGRPLRTEEAARHLLDASRRRSGTADLSLVRRDLQHAASILAALARSASGSPPVPSAAISPSVRGAFADALVRPKRSEGGLVPPTRPPTRPRKRVARRRKRRSREGGLVSPKRRSREGGR